MTGIGRFQQVCPFEFLTSRWLRLNFEQRPRKFRHLAQPSKAVSEQEYRMDLYSILGQQLSIDDVLPPEAALAADAPPFSAQPLSAEPLGEKDALTLALRLLAESKLTALLTSAVERVRYITNASGVALALCENEEDAMVCRASSGPSAPEVGARMYIRSGITAESMRTRQTLRCDRASTDPRVNQESCKALGIESVMVMPLILERNVVGMFELFGSKPSAFAERDATTLRAAFPQVESGLREAVVSGMPLGRIPWAEEAPAPVHASVDIAADIPIDTPLDIAMEIAMAANDETNATGDIPDAPAITLKIPVAFPIDSFRKAEAQENKEREARENQEVPAFLARLADEARPAANRTWSQWFRPQW